MCTIAFAGDEGGGGGGGAIKAEGGCPSVLSGVRLLRRGFCTGGSVGWLPNRWVGRERLREVGSQLGYPSARGEIILSV